MSIYDAFEIIVGYLNNLCLDGVLLDEEIDEVDKAVEIIYQFINKYEPKAE